MAAVSLDDKGLAGQGMEEADDCLLEDSDIGGISPSLAGNRIAAVSGRDDSDIEWSVHIGDLVVAGTVAVAAVFLFWLNTEGKR
jgi:hypothetical protein